MLPKIRYRGIHFHLPIIVIGIVFCLGAGEIKAREFVEHKNGGYREERPKLDFDRIYNLTNDDGTPRTKVEALGEILKERINLLRKAPGGKADLVFLIDSSTSVGKKHFWYELRFVEKLLVDFTVDRNSTRVAVIRFSSESRIQRIIDHMTQPSDEFHKCSLMHALPRIEYKYGGTYTRRAIHEAQRVLRAKRSDAKQAVFLVTDGYSNGGDPRPLAAELRRENVEFFTFGIRGGNARELWEMASEPKIKHTYILDSFAEFEALARRALHEDLPIGQYMPLRAGKCGHLCDAGYDCCDEMAVCTCGTHTGKYECACSEGFYGTGFKGGCAPCPTGTYKNLTEPGDEAMCIPCPDANEASAPGSKTVDQCSCKLGYRRSGIHACAEMTCPKLTAPDNGYFVQERCNNVYNAACGIRCNPGYQLTGSSLRLCRINGTWTGSLSTCTIRTCEVLLAPRNGQMACSKEDFSFETACEFLCNAGYKLVGSSHRKCLSMGFWNGINTSCREVECTKLTGPVDGHIEPRSCTARDSPFGTVCRYQCREGYRLAGSHSRQCSSIGNWNPKSDVDSVCVDVAPPVMQGCPRDMVAETEKGDYIAKVTWLPPIAIDNSGFFPMVTPVPAVVPPVAIPIGSTNFMYIAEDGNRNKANCSFTVHVFDRQPPRIDKCSSPPPFVLRNNDVTVRWEIPEFSDNSRRPMTIKNSHKPGKFALGESIVVYTAIDESGNNSTCIIHIVVKQHACADPRQPLNGNIECKDLPDDVVCKLSCNSGYDFAMPPAPEYHCDYMFGHWTPEKYLPLPDCSSARLSNSVEQAARIAFKSSTSCDDRLRLSQIESTIWRKIDQKVDGYCPPNDICDVDHQDLLCSDDEISNKINIFGNPFLSHRRLRRRRDIEDNLLSFQTTTRTTSLQEHHQQRILAVDFKLRGKVDKVDDTITSGEQAALRQDVITVMHKIRVAAGNGEFDENLVEYQAVFEEMVLGSDTPQTVCDPGYVVKDDNCVACASGTFYNVMMEKCVVCPQGTYQHQEGQLTCLVCPDHTSTSNNNSRSIDQCKGQCLPGSFSDKGLELCETCPEGWYQPEYASKACLQCPAGNTTWGRGARQLIDCKEMCREGYISRSGLAPCFPCPRGHFQPEPGKSSCFLCPGNVDTSRHAATDISECEGLPPITMTDFNVVPTSQLLINDCLMKSPCLNGSTCESMEVGYLCHCVQGWTGVHCELEIDECQSNPCHNNASCHDHLDGYTCVCQPEYTGTHCEVNIDDCASSPCQNEGTCFDGVGRYRCECSEGYIGVDCETDDDDCQTSPCEHGATCVDMVSGYTCSCVPGYTGETCQTNIDECNSGPCTNEATCVDAINSYTCACVPGYTGENCQTEVNECISDPCHQGSTCEDHVNKYTCTCPPAYSGVHCETKLNASFDLYFAETTGLSDYVALDGQMPNLTQLTIVFWMRANYTGNHGTPISYATEIEDNALTITDYDGLLFTINGFKRITDIKVADGLWHHVCVVWSSNDGSWAIYLDGVRREHGVNVATGTYVSAGGVLVLGQEQDARGGKFNSKETFLGLLSGLNIWDYNLPDEEIVQMMLSCREYTGNVRAWPDLLAGIHGSVTRTESQLCKACQEPNNITHGDVVWNGTDIGDIAMYTCSHGYRLMGYDRRKCGVNSTWDLLEPFCERVKCGYTTQIENSRIVVFNNTYGGITKYECDQGYRLVGNDTLRCNIDGEWDAEEPTCEEIFCERPPRQPHMSIYPFRERRPREVIRFSCVSGYKVEGEEVLRCQDDGEWSDPYPECIEETCKNPPSIPNGNPSEPDKVYKIGEFAPYKCETGYKFQTIGSNRKCGFGGTWSRVAPRCGKVYCRKPSEILHGTQHGGDFSYGGLVTYTCSEGYVLQGSAAVKCTEAGSWNTSIPTCEPVECPELPLIDNGSIKITLRTFNSTAQYSCMERYLLKGAFLRVCTSSGLWSDEPPVCEPIRCMPPKPVQHGTVIGDLFFHGTYANYSCYPGYVLIGAPDIRCGSAGMWVNEAPTCAPVMCSQPPGLEHGRIVGNEYYVNDTFEYSCDNGYKLVGARSRVCLINGAWDTKEPYCEEILCKPPNPIHNGIYKEGALKPGSLVSYECTIGYEIDGKKSRTCKTDGTWTGPTPKCKALRCLLPKHIQYGRFVADDNMYGSTIDYVCDQGYKLEGNNSRTCSSDKQWNGSEPQCMRSKCPPPSSISYGKHIGDELYTGSVITYKCEPGFKLQGDSLRICLDAEKWNGSDPQCKPVECDKPATVVSNGRMISTNFTFGAVVQYVCDAGYEAEEPISRVCQGDGSWLNPIPICERVTCPEPDIPEHATLDSFDFRFQEYVGYRCKTGYTITKPTRRRCESDKSWSGNIPSCYPVICPLLSAPDNGKVKSDARFYNNQTEYECNSGYELIGVSTVTCLANGHWSNTSPRCSKIHCASPPNLANGVVDAALVPVWQTVKYKCEPGFVLLQTGPVTCTINGTFSGEIPTCKRVNCSSAPDIEYGDKFQLGTYFEDVATYSCHIGYELSGSSVMTCNEQGLWGGDQPSCDPVQCPRLSSLKNGEYLRQYRYLFGANITFECRGGYELVGDAVTECGQDGMWTSPMPTCQITYCTEPLIQHGSVVISSGYINPQSNPKQYPFETFIEIQCEEGHERNGSLELECLEDMTWSKDIPTCTIVTCRVPDVEQLQIKAPSGYTFNNRILLNCELGYDIHGPTEVYCLADRTWSEEFPTCAPVTCQAPVFEHGTFKIIHSPNVGFGYPLGIQLEFGCDIGTYLIGPEKLTCKEDGYWTDAFPHCDSYTCELPDSGLPHAPQVNPKKDMHEFNDTVKFSCEVGYKLSGTEYLTCGDGVWNGTLPTCKQVECPSKHIQHGTVYFQKYRTVAAIRSRFLQSSMITFECELGYKLVGAGALTCQQDGTWSDQFPVCSPVTCPTPHIAHGYVDTFRGDLPGFQVGVTVPVFCKTGYHLADNFAITCLPNGTWTKLDISCSVVTCKVPELDGGTIVSKEPNGHIHFAYDDKIRVICLHGYLLIGEAGIIRCTESTEWDKEIPVCKKRECSVPPIEHSLLMINGEPKVTLVEFGDVVTVDCDEGYKVNGPMKLQCTATGKLSEAIPKCDPVKCPSLLIENGFVDNGDVAYGAVVNIACMLGYEIYGDEQLTCKGKGDWSGVIPICAMIECSKPDIGNGKVMGNISDFNFGTIVSFQCDSGYQLEGSHELLCMPDSSWSEQSPICKKIVCKDPPTEIDNGNVDTTKPKGDVDYIYGTILSYTCELGYGLTTAGNISCESGGHWSSDFPSCEQNSCLYPAIENGYAAGSSSGTNGAYVFGDTVNFKCKPGYEIRGAPEMVCDPFGNWTDSFPVCVRLECPSPKQIRNGQFEGDSFEYGETVSYSCDEGYDLIGTHDVACLSDQTWEDLPICNVIICELPQKIEHGTYLATGLLYGSKIRYACHEGHELQGEVEHTCRSDRSWSGAVPTCLPVQCTDPIPPLLNGNPMHHHGYMQAVVYIYEDKVHYDCAEGYEKNGLGVIECTADGTWTGLDTTCDIINCGVPPILVNGHIQEGIHTYGSSLKYRCDTGFVLEGDDTIWCGNDGEWNTTLPTCLPISCPYPGILRHGTLKYGNLKIEKEKDFTDLVPHGFYLSDHIDFSCDTGYILDGDSKLECLPSGNWSGRRPSCPRVRCGPVPNIPFGIVDGVQGKFGDKLEVNCTKGYELDDAILSSIKCDADTNWDTKGVACRMIVCPRPDKIEKGQYVGGPYKFNMTVDYMCKEGYSLSGNSHRRCQSNKEWSGTTPVCVPVMCEQPDPIENGYYSINAGTVLQFGAVVAFGCDEGYELRGRTDAKCLANGHWNASSPQCVPVLCPEPESFPHATILRSLVQVYKSVVEYTCEFGYVLSGESFRTCQANKTWSGYPPKCDEVACTYLPSIPYGNFREVETTFNSVVTYQCDDMHDLLGDSERVCQGNGIWSGTEPVCLSKVCPEPPFLPHGTMIGRNYSAGASVEFRCDDGYQISGKEQIICMGNEWNEHFPRCKMISCGPPPNIDYAVISGSDYKYGRSVEYSCLEGYAVAGNASITCQSNGSWSVVNVSCEPVSCGPPHELPNMYYKKEGMSYGDFLVYGCDHGYEIHGNNILVCNSAGMWEGLYPECKMVTCGTLPVIPHASVTLSRMTFSSIATYICNRGYILVGSPIVECMANATWMHKDKLTCRPVDCGRLPLLENGGVKVPAHTLGNVAHYYCLEGYVLMGNRTLQCYYNGEWNASAPTCVAINCVTPHAPSNGMVDGTQFEFGHDILYTCRPGFKLVGDSVRTCMPDGRWSGQQPRCDLIYCPPIVTPEHGNVTFTDRRHYNSVALFQCDPTYDLVGNNTIKCLVDGTWDTLAPICVPAVPDTPPCPPPDVPDNALITSGNFVVGDTITMDCVPGYRPSEPMAATCQEDLTWTRLEGQCQRMSCGRPADQPWVVQLGSRYLHGDRVMYVCRRGLRPASNPVLTCTANGTWDKTPQCLATCKFECRNGGACVGPNLCKCQPGYSGRFCEQAQCVLPCLHGGKCVAPYRCSCHQGYVGARCQRPVCSKGCQNGGVCIMPNRCYCPHGYRPPFCEG